MLHRPRDVVARDIVHRAGQFRGVQNGTGAVVEQPNVETLLIEKFRKPGFVVVAARPAHVFLRHEAESGLGKAIEHQQRLEAGQARRRGFVRDLRLTVARQSKLDTRVVGFRLFPVATWIATLVLDLPPQIEIAMILVAVCLGGTTNSFITHLGGGNAALSLSISAVGALLAVFLTPLNFSWMVAGNPATASWITSLGLDTTAIWITLFALLALPLGLGLAFAEQWPWLTGRLRKPLGRVAIACLLAFILIGIAMQRKLLTLDLLPILSLVILHNAAGLALGHATAGLMKVSAQDGRAVTIEGGMQNAGLALGIVAVQFQGDLQMVVFVSLWGVWHSVSGLSLAAYWRRQDRKALSSMAAQS